jgi:hypothetical protein
MTPCNLLCGYQHSDGTHQEVAENMFLRQNGTKLHGDITQKTKEWAFYFVTAIDIGVLGMLRSVCKAEYQINKKNIAGNFFLWLRNVVL